MSEVARPWCRCDVWAWGVSGKKKHCQPQELQHVSGFPSSLGNRCPSPKCCSEQMGSEQSLSRLHLIRSTSSHTAIHISYHAVGGERGMRQGTVGGQKAISVALRCLEKHRTAGYSSKGCSSWLWECYCDLRRDNIRATTETRFKTLTVKVWQEKNKQFGLNSYTASLSSSNSLAFGQRPRAHSYSPCTT